MSIMFPFCVQRWHARHTGNGNRFSFINYCTILGDQLTIFKPENDLAPSSSCMANVALIFPAELSHNSQSSISDERATCLKGMANDNSGWLSLDIC